MIKRKAPKRERFYGFLWAVISKTNTKHVPCIAGRRRADARELCEADERVIRVWVQEMRSR